jgi:hypothetical protein
LRDTKQAEKEYLKRTGNGVALFSEPGGARRGAGFSGRHARLCVLEQNIVAGRFMQQCHEAGFQDVRVKPFSYAIPDFDLTLQQWEAWSRLASSKRPLRALAKMGRACDELFGIGKRGPLFEEAFAILLVRTLRPLIEHHPIIVASKLPPTRKMTGPRWRAELEAQTTSLTARGGDVSAAVKATNRGTAHWRSSSRSGIGHVALGVQLMDQSARMVSRDYHRVTLPHAVAPGQAVTMAFTFPAPREPGTYVLTFDLVVEGVTWFETTGSTPVSNPLNVRM